MSGEEEGDKGARMIFRSLQLLIGVYLVLLWHCGMLDFVSSYASSHQGCPTQRHRYAKPPPPLHGPYPNLSPSNPLASSTSPPHHPPPPRLHHPPNINSSPCNQPILTNRSIRQTLRHRTSTIANPKLAPSNAYQRAIILTGD